MWLDSLRQDFGNVDVSLEHMTMGTRLVAPDEQVAGDLVVYRGNAEVSGTVDGDVVALFGDVVIRPGARIEGDALAIGGRARLEGGEVTGEIRSISGAVFPVARAAETLTPAQRTTRNLSLAIGWFIMLAVIGGALALFAREKLERIAETVRENFTRAFLVGLLAEVAFVPAIVLSVVALAITIIGILLVPFAVVALLLGAAGALALGFVAVAFLAGETFSRGGARAQGARALRAVLVGLAVYFGLWLLAAAFSWAGFFGGLLRLVSAALTWVAVTVGFGATLLSRGGTRLAATHTIEAPVPEDEVSWQTPTPVSGVAAARRPTPAPRPREP
jgi:hypothetical protein